MSITRGTARRLAFHIDCTLKQAGPAGRALRLLRAALAPLGRRRLPSSLHAVPLSDHVRRDIGLDTPAGAHLLVSQMPAGRDIQRRRSR